MIYLPCLTKKMDMKAASLLPDRFLLSSTDEHVAWHIISLCLPFYQIKAMRGTAPDFLLCLWCAIKIALMLKFICSSFCSYLNCSIMDWAMYAVSLETTITQMNLTLANRFPLPLIVFTATDLVLPQSLSCVSVRTFSFASMHWWKSSRTSFFPQSFSNTPLSPQGRAMTPAWPQRFICHVAITLQKIPSFA